MSFVVDYLLYLIINNAIKGIAPAMAQQVSFLFLTFVPHIAIGTVGAQ